MLDPLRRELRHGWRRLLSWGLATALLSQVTMLVLLAVRFGELPNYATFYDWPGNVLRIIETVPSVRDMGPIIAQEWLLEIGRMNYDYGNGISVWALSVVPAKLAMLFLLGALAGLATALMRRPSCPASLRGGAGAVTGAGAVLVAMTNATMSWVVCCATPNWVVGLAMMGLGTSASLALEPLGTPLALAGFGLLALAILALSARASRLPSFETEPSHA
ncbi:hypothetical protein [Mangrovicoccus sp. HB161399]|uniref:hypothetical protein n=1 Tax=Mangrovicoccus sp. HB161399 TaxID=2720392 RepID=UPI0015522412|nr:hypothetical protein [Mangrovicoccus sp. HB161399]